MHTHLGRASFLTITPLSAPEQEGERKREREGEHLTILLSFHPLLITGDSANNPSPHPPSCTHPSPIQPSEQWEPTLFSHTTPGASEGYDHLSLAMWPLFLYSIM